ncbi:glycosyltransferase family 4 protein [Spiribacter onubensis]|uniref:Glycosyltransferase family 1 protein n=1 Tax=Spiribacter onubensis TaxID=3122420 RepID=A0ABV3SA78_9GAMM
MQRYIQGLLAGLSGLESVEVLRRLKISRWRKRGLLPASPIASRWYGPLLGVSPAGLDVIHCANPTLPYATWGVPMVTTVHDLYMARHATEITRNCQARKLRSVLQACARCVRIIVPSRAIKAELAELLDDERKVVVVPHGLSNSFRAIGRLGADVVQRQKRPYLMTFCGGRRKNIENTVEAFSRLKLDAQGWRMLIIGMPTPTERDVVGRQLPRDRYSFRWGIDDKALVRAYANAEVICYPSLYEGFGFPVLEGMASGRPVVTGDQGATAEVAGGHARTVTAQSPESIASGIEAALDMKTYELADARRHALGFSWEDCARRLVDLYGDAREL